MDYTVIKRLVCPSTINPIILHQYLVLLALLWILSGMKQTAARLEPSTQFGKMKSEEERLLVYLLEHYNPAARPILDSSRTVPVNMSYSLMHIHELVSSI